MTLRGPDSVTEITDPEYVGHICDTCVPKVHIAVWTTDDVGRIEIANLAHSRTCEWFAAIVAEGRAPEGVWLAADSNMIIRNVYVSERDDATLDPDADRQGWDGRERRAKRHP